MIVTRITGGLGNQLFQAAAGLHLANKQQQDLLLDLSWYERFDNRDYLLAELELDWPKADSKLVKRLTGSANKLLNRIANRATYYKEQHFHYDENIADLSGEIYLDGLWQSWRYGAAELKEKLKMNGIKMEKALAIHIRRGDYLEKNHYAILGSDYYNTAWQALGCPDLPAYIFCDDPNWVNEKMKFDFSYQNCGSPNVLQDFKRIASCSHVITANSTFSWWAAWLNPFVENRIATPAQWYLDGRNIKDLIPPDWKTINV